MHHRRSYRTLLCNIGLRDKKRPNQGSNLKVRNIVTRDLHICHKSQRMLRKMCKSPIVVNKFSIHNRYCRWEPWSKQSSFCNHSNVLEIWQVESLFSVIHCNTLQHAATHFDTLQHTSTHCNTLQHIQKVEWLFPNFELWDTNVQKAFGLSFVNQIISQTQRALECKR